MVTYNDYLEKIKVISEDEFNSVIELFPEISEIDGSVSSDDTIDELCQIICNSFLEKYNYAYCDSVDFDKRTLNIIDIESINDLNEIVNELSNWTISNYDELVKQIEEEMETDERDTLIDKIKNFSTETLRLIVNKYANEK